MVPTEFVTAEPDHVAVHLGVTPPANLPAEVLPGLTLTTAPTGRTALTIIVGGRLHDHDHGGARRVGQRRVCVLRGPCYLALRRLVGGVTGSTGSSLAEPRRALTERDVIGVDVLATVADVTPPQYVEREFRSIRRPQGCLSTGY